MGFPFRVVTPEVTVVMSSLYGPAARTAGMTAGSSIGAGSFSRAGKRVERPTSEVGAARIRGRGTRARRTARGAGARRSAQCLGRLSCLRAPLAALEMVAIKSLEALVAGATTTAEASDRREDLQGPGCGPGSGSRMMMGARV